MFEKVNTYHPDKIADRIAGALVDLAYKKEADPKIAAEVLIGHGNCNVIVESSVSFTDEEVQAIVDRIAGEGNKLNLVQVPQDKHLADNQSGKLRCGDNGIFMGGCISPLERELTDLAKRLDYKYKSDGKYILTETFDYRQLTICQSNLKATDNIPLDGKYDRLIINPLGEWTGGTNVDTGATNRKLGSDMGEAVLGGGLHGKDLSKADVSVNIYCHVKAQEINSYVKAFCSIGDETVKVRRDGKDLRFKEVPFEEVVETARAYINKIGGFEKFAEWGLIR